MRKWKKPSAEVYLESSPATDMEVLPQLVHGFKNLRLKECLRNEDSTST